MILVDRDGSLAMMVAGILSQKTQRPIKALHGGLEAYWVESELRTAVKAVPLPQSGTVSGPAARPAAPASPPAATPAQPQTPSTPKKKSAGC